MAERARLLHMPPKKAETKRVVLSQDELKFIKRWGPIIIKAPD